MSKMKKGINISGSGKDKQPSSAKSHQPSVEEILALRPSDVNTDTAMALIEIYESIERSYRAAILAGEAQPCVTQSTNY